MLRESAGLVDDACSSQIIKGNALRLGRIFLRELLELLEVPFLLLLELMLPPVANPLLRGTCTTAPRS